MTTKLTELENALEYRALCRAKHDAEVAVNSLPHMGIVSINVNGKNVEADGYFVLLGIRTAIQRNLYEKYKVEEVEALLRKADLIEEEVA